jgi:hypothetical protein
LKEPKPKPKHVLSITAHSRDHLRLQKRSSSMSVYLTAVSVCRSLRVRLSQSKTPTPMFDGIPLLGGSAIPNIFQNPQRPKSHADCSTVSRAFNASGWPWIALLRTSLLPGYVRLYISAIGMPSRIPNHADST